ncbi:MAG: hypothetical protein B6U72_02930 [Candidatus Altiarchaeales archaeon ex4484_2]|nr:MAG: hypothetical protein B6U72_02930 [Candidatus Altiarchaeales archaeon ex4484_2]
MEEEYEGTTQYGRPPPLPPTDDDYMREDLNYMEGLMNEQHVEAKTKKNHFGLFSKATILANFSDSDIKVFQLRARQRTLKLQLLLPPEKKTVNMSMDLESIETQHSKELRRAKQGFERRQMVTRVSESHMNKPEAEKKGLFGFFR